MLHTAQFSQLLALQAIKQSRFQRAFEQLADSADLQEFLNS